MEEETTTTKPVESAAAIRLVGSEVSKYLDNEEGHRWFITRRTDEVRYYIDNLINMGCRIRLFLDVDRKRSGTTLYLNLLVMFRTYSHRRITKEISRMVGSFFGICATTTDLKDVENKLVPELGEEVTQIFNEYRDNDLHYYL
jgi:hypothetical protein